MTLTRIEKLLEGLSRERLISQSPYEFKDRRGPADESRGDYAQIASISRLNPRSEQEWRALEDEIKAAEYILRIQQEAGEEEFESYSPETLGRATSFLRRLMIQSHTSNLLGLGIPKIGPADRGSIDLYWGSEKCTLLINFPAHENVANYYGRKQKSEISGRFDPSEARAELVVWLAD